MPLRMAGKIGSFGGILRSHGQRFENKLAEIASAKWYCISKYLQVNIGHFGAVFYVSTI